MGEKELKEESQESTEKSGEAEKSKEELGQAETPGDSVELSGRIPELQEELQKKDRLIDILCKVACEK